MSGRCAARPPASPFSWSRSSPPPSCWNSSPPSLGEMKRGKEGGGGEGGGEGGGGEGGGGEGGGEGGGREGEGRGREAERNQEGRENSTFKLFRRECVSTKLTKGMESWN